MSSQSQFALLKTRQFAPFFVVQSLGALNDNILRNGLVMLMTFSVLPDSGYDVAVLANVIAGLFILPFVLFSAIAGQLADKYDKSLLIQRIKLLEIALVLFAAWALSSGYVIGLLALVFAMGLQSTLFGPIKYAVLPQLVAREALIGANGLVEGGTYLAIVVGLFIGGYVAGFGDAGVMLMSSIMFVVAIIGYLASRAVPPVVAGDPNISLRLNIVTETVRVCRYAYRERSVFLSIMGLSWFWAFGLIALAQLPAFGQQVLNGTPQLANALLVCFAIGIGIGSLVCEKLSRKHIELGLVPLGAIGLSLFSFDIFLTYVNQARAVTTDVPTFIGNISNWRLLFDLTMIGISGGLFSVPLYAMMQDRSPARIRSRIIAANNIINSVLMIIGAAVASTLLLLDFSIPEIFAFLAITNAVVTLYLFWLLPEFVMRFLTWLLVNVLYRVRVENADRIPREGPHLLVANHVSFVDALLIGGAVMRPTRFVMYYKIFKIPVLSFIFKTAKAIPIAGYKEDPELLTAAFEKIDQELADGRVVCIFPEGAITRDGAIHPFRGGMGKILERRPVPVIPIALGGLWGSWFSRQGGGAVKKLPRRFRAKITVSIGEVVPAEQATAEHMQHQVQQLLDQTQVKSGY
ncbi:MAG: MFS transporter [Woeseiaceae bacterium]